MKRSHATLAAVAGRHIQRAKTLESQGRSSEAAELLIAAAKEFPRDAEIYLQLGNLLATQGNWHGAELCYAKRCVLQPQSATGQYNWGIALQELGRDSAAIEAFERALLLNPHYAVAYFGLGLSYQRIEAFESAQLAFECAVAIDGSNTEFQIEQARTLIKAGNFREASAALDEFLEKFPEAPEALNLSGIALKNLRRPQDALAAYDRAITARPHFAEALNNRGNLRLLARQFSLALEDFDQALALNPHMDWLSGTRLYAAMHVYEWKGFEEHMAALRADLAQQRRVIQPLALQCLADEPELQQQAARLWTSTTCPVKAGLAAEPVSASEGKIRVAYISRDFRSHPVSFLMAEVFELHDRDQFEIIALNYGPKGNDATQERLRLAFDSFLDVEHLQDREIAELSRSLSVDIAVDLTGLTEGARSALFSWRAAPVQISYIGYLGTAGSALYDYLIADPTLIPEATRPFYDEHLIFLPSYQANDRQRPRPPLNATRSELGLPETGFVYCCFNNPCKITPEVFSKWAAILKQVPASVMWVLDEDERAAANLRRHGESLGIAAHRIVFAKRTHRDAYLASLNAADLFLDTLPYNAGATASDALWMGLPVLTQIGRSFAGRVAASLLNATGLPELIAHNAADYIQTAVRLAQQPEALARIKQSLQKSRLACALFDTPRFTRTLEIAYREAHRVRLSGEARKDIVIVESIT